MRWAARSAASSQADAVAAASAFLSDSASACASYSRMQGRFREMSADAGADDEVTQRAHERREQEAARQANSALERLLRKACEEGHIEAAQRLLDAGVSPSGANSSGSTPLHEAAFAGHRSVCELLLERDVRSEEQDKWGASALHHAASNGWLDVVRLLLEHGGDVNAMSQSQLMPIDLAQKGGHGEVALLLADVACRVAEGRRRETQRRCSWGALVFSACAAVVAVGLYLAGYIGQDQALLAEAHLNSL